MKATCFSLNLFCLRGVGGSVVCLGLQEYLLSAITARAAVKGPELGTACLRSELGNPCGINSKAGSPGRQQQEEGTEPVPCCPEAGQSLPGLCRDTGAVGKPGHWESRDSTAQRAQPGTSSSRQIVQDSVSSPFSPQCLLLTPCMQMLLKALQSSNRNQAGS